MIISLIAAMNVNHVIGNKNKIPWNIPEDIAWFKYHTINKLVIMGRKTYDSIGGPLTSRLNVVISNNSLSYIKYNNLIFVETPWKALSMFRMYDTEIMIIGGELIFNFFIHFAHRLYLTLINIDVDGDVFFPYYDRDRWKSTFTKIININNDYSCCFKILDYISFND